MSRWKSSEILIKYEMEIVQYTHPGIPFKQNFGFNTTNSPPQLKELVAFEDDLFTMIKELKFRQVRNSFQNDLTKRVQEIRNSKEIIVKADKTRNLYKIPVDQYRNLLRNNITSEYKKSSDNEVNKVNKEASKIAKKLKIDDRVDKYIESNAFITLKDHKPEFMSRLPCRLINPGKSNLGKVSKIILENMVKHIKMKTSSNQ